MILAGIDHVGSVERVAQALVEALARPFELQGERLCISASVGVALYPPDAGNVGDLLARADEAMYASKHPMGAADLEAMAQAGAIRPQRVMM